MDGKRQSQDLSSTEEIESLPQFRVSYFIDQSWEQIRELTYLAVSEDAREILIEASKLKTHARRSSFTPPSCSEGDIIRIIDQFLQRSVRNDFTSALARRTYMISMESVPVVHLDDDESSQSRESMSLRPAIKLDQDKKSAGVGMNGIVYAVYEKYRARIGAEAVPLCTRRPTRAA